MNFFRFLRARAIAWYLSWAVTLLFGFFWCLWVLPLFEKSWHRGNLAGVGLLIGVILCAIIFVVTCTSIIRWFDRRDAATARWERDSMRAEDDEWRRTHPL
jgi:hypothetical protein